MIELRCTSCGSGSVVRNGKTGARKQKFHCKECGAYRTLLAEEVYSEEFRLMVVHDYLENGSMRTVAKENGIALSTLLSWVKGVKEIS